MTISISYFEFHLGLGDASSLMIGQQIGKMKVDQARFYFKLFLGLSLLFVIVNSLVFYFKGD